MPTQMLRDGARGARVGPAEAGGIFPVGAFGRGDGRSPPAHAGPPGAGGARTVCRAARTRRRGRASHLGRRAAAGSRMGRRPRPAAAAPRRPDFPISWSFYPNETDCEASAPCGAGLRRAGWRRCCWRRAAAASSSSSSSFDADPDHRVRRRDQRHRRHRRQRQRPQVQRQRHRLGDRPRDRLPRQPDLDPDPGGGATAPSSSRTCNPAGSAVFDPPNRIRATVGARAADLATQIDAQLAAGRLPRRRPGDRAGRRRTTCWRSTPQYPSVSEVAAQRQRRGRGRRGRAPGQPPGRRSAPGSSSRPSRTSASRPTRIAEKAAHIDTDRQALIQRLVEQVQHRPEAAS